ncbi:MAG TPA: Stk1 family PASTA domain-containing Ser/Thr kinase [Ilumatobacter sp.]|nr:Stk1 family PASTA domain-containing Ser/Thr kinase [Ilumatobacter sp.]
MSNSRDATVINDRYEIHKRVGRGGMADVFLARDRLLDRQVAIKVLFPEFAVDPNFVERFRREAQAAANLSHPNIVNVYDWGKYEGTYFIAMEYVHGRTLAEILKTNNRLTPKQGAEIASEVAAALGFAHEAGLAHRDIKPANILIGSSGQVKVADFGIARAMNSATESNLTQAGSVMGTASYFSPEQAQGAQPDPRSDLYSLGIVMYEMIAGKPPFTGENAVSIAYKQVHDQPTPLNRVVEGVPRPFEAIIAKLLAKDPKLRYPSAHALRDDLRRFRNGEQVQALVAAAARPGTPAAGSARPAADPTQPNRAMQGAPTMVVGSTPTVTQQQAGPTAVHPQIAGAPTTALPTQRSHDLTQYPPGASAEARYYQDNNSRTGWYALAAFIALIALAAGGVLLYQGLTNEQEQQSEQRLDNYVNQPLDSVTAALTALDLDFTSIAEDNPLFNENFVHKTDPPAGAVVSTGTVIQLYYNPTKALVAVPNVAGVEFAAARTTLSENGFAIAEPITEKNADVPEGSVIRTDPPADARVPQDTVVVVYVSGGPNQVSIPGSIINDEVAVATATLQSAEYGLVVNVVEEQNETSPVGTVIRSEPAPNNLVDRGSTITLFVSSGPGQVIVPTLRGTTETQARNLIDAEGLAIDVQYVDVNPGDGNDGRVIEQSFTPGQMVDKGTLITVTVGVAREAATTTTSTSTTTTTTTTIPETTTTAATTTTPATSTP